MYRRYCGVSNIYQVHIYVSGTSVPDTSGISLRGVGSKQRLSHFEALGSYHGVAALDGYGEDG